MYVYYFYDAEAILVRPMKSRSEAGHIRVYKDMFDYLEKRSLCPDYQTIYDECSAALKFLIVDINKNKLQLVPPHDHRTNPAEKSIDTFKCRFIFRFMLSRSIISSPSVMQIITTL